MVSHNKPFHRRTIRLKDYDYSQAGMYFLTIVVHKHEMLFGRVVDDAMQLNDYGTIVQTEWLRTPKVRPNAMLDAFVVMPNHVHGIIIIADPASAACAHMSEGVHAHRARTGLSSPRQTIGAIIRGFKSLTAIAINTRRNTARKPVWQRNYYEHIIRSEKALNAIRRYIDDNPGNWSQDVENPVNVLRGSAEDRNAIP